MQIKSCLLLAVFATLFTGCSSLMQRTDHQASVGADKALLSVYYRFNPLAGTPAEIFVNDTSYGQLAMRHGLQIEVEPGKHTVYAMLGRNWGVMDAEFAAGKRYYAYLVVAPDGFTAGRANLAPVTRDQDIPAIAREFEKALTLEINPVKRERWQQNRSNVTQRIKQRHQSGGTRPTQITAADGI